LHGRRVIQVKTWHKCLATVGFNARHSTEASDPERPLLRSITRIRVCVSQIFSVMPTRAEFAAARWLEPTLLAPSPRRHRDAEPDVIPGSHALARFRYVWRALARECQRLACARMAGAMMISLPCMVAGAAAAP
jgi:hypothetical protein